jgi:hypothetical protein
MSESLHPDDAQRHNPDPPPAPDHAPDDRRTDHDLPLSELPDSPRPRLTAGARRRQRENKGDAGKQRGRSSQSQNVLMRRMGRTTTEEHDQSKGTGTPPRLRRIGAEPLGSRRQARLFLRYSPLEPPTEEPMPHFSRRGLFRRAATAEPDNARIPWERALNPEQAGKQTEARGATTHPSRQAESRFATTSTRGVKTGRPTGNSRAVLCCNTAS